MPQCNGAGGAGMQFTYAQLQGLWIAAGGPRAVAPVAGAIALAESSGCSTVQNPADNNGTQTSWGLWQISNGTHNPPAANIYDPAVNAQQAVAKYQGAGNTFAPWGTYTSGAYKAYVNGSTTPDIPVSAAAAGTGDATCAVSWPVFVPAGKLPVIGTTITPQVGGSCMIHKATIRHMTGGVLLAAGGFVALPGLLILVAFTFRTSGAAKMAAQVLPGPYGTAAGVAAGTSPVPRITTRRTRKPAAAPKTPSRARQPASGPRGTPQGRHARTGPNAPATGRHARRGP